VLPDAPALFLIGAGAGCDLELAARLFAGEVFRDVELREVLPDDLVGAVAFDALGTGIPGENVAVRIESEDGVVANAFDEEPIESVGLISDGECRAGRQLRAVRGGASGPVVSHCSGGSQPTAVS